jgi:hypothetical protein
MMQFLRFICEHDSVKKTESLRQYWKQFYMLHFQMNERRVKPLDAYKIWKVECPNRSPFETRYTDLEL